MTRAARFVLTALAVALLVIAVDTVEAHAAGGNYVFDGGSVAQRTQVRKALDASAFPWGVVGNQVTIHIGAPSASQATPGEIWLDAALLNSGKFAWGVVQHEYAHQVDFSLLEDAHRAQLLTRLGGTSWWGLAGSSHASRGAERFASTLAWAYWQSSANSMQPRTANDESGAMDPARFRAVLSRLIGAS
jgi:hypothetical protein